MQLIFPDNLILAGHDVSEGGVLTCLAEMAFAGCCGLDIKLPHIITQDHGCLTSPDFVSLDMAMLFAEELGSVQMTMYF